MRPHLAKRFLSPLILLLALLIALSGSALAQPAVTNASVTPATLPPLGGDITVSADVTGGGSGLSQVYVGFFQDGTSRGDLSMSNGGTGSHYTVTYTLPANATTTPVVWKLQVTGQDNNGKTTVAPDLTVTVAGDPGVVITNPTVTPTTLPPLGGTITISATITDAAVLLSQVYVGFIQDGVPRGDLSMSNSDNGSLYSVTYTLPANPTPTPVVWKLQITGSSKTGAQTTAPDLTVTIAGDPGVVISNAAIAPPVLTASGGNITFSANVTDAAVSITQVYVGFFQDGVFHGNLSLDNGGSGNVYTGSFTAPPNNTASPITFTFQITGVSKTGAQAMMDLVVKQSNRNPSTVAGKVTLQDTPYQAQPVTFNFRSTDGGITYTQMVTPDNMGNFALTNVPTGAYNLAIKGYKWLQVTRPVDTTSGNVTGLAVSLANGDANDDNSVDIGDFGVLVNAYNSDRSISGSGYDIRADFNDDGIVDIADFGILVNNYNLSGAP